MACWVPVPGKRLAGLAATVASLALAFWALEPGRRLTGPAVPARMLLGAGAGDLGEAAANATAANGTAVMPPATAANLSTSPRPTKAPENTTHAVVQGCLCIFDVDRTLTGRQEDTSTCPGNAVIGGIWDPAYSGGQLTLSDLGQGIQRTFCGGCYLGIVSAGNAGGWDMRNLLHARLQGRGSLPDAWSGPNPVTSPLVVGCHDGYKPTCVQGVINWYRSHGIEVPRQEVYFFDDKRGNIDGVGHAGYNAHQVSCTNRRRRRKYAQGLCGGKVSEAKHQQGMSYCD